jgi:4-aminobutyrate aminotransferase-like enzyme
MMNQELVARRNQALGEGMPLFYTTPLHIVRGEGVWLFDADGRRYLDMYNNVPCVGHGNPHVVEAMARQQGTLNVHSRYLHEGILDFAERLVALHGPQIESVVVSCTGTEAVEVALRMARFATGKSGVVCSNATYHGNSELVSKAEGCLSRAARGGDRQPRRERPGLRRADPLLDPGQRGTARYPLGLHGRRRRDDPGRGRNRHR